MTAQLTLHQCNVTVDIDTTNKQAFSRTLYSALIRDYAATGNVYFAAFTLPNPFALFLFSVMNRLRPFWLLESSEVPKVLLGPEQGRTRHCMHTTLCTHKHTDSYVDLDGVSTNTNLHRNQFTRRTDAYMLTLPTDVVGLMSCNSAVI